MSCRTLWVSALVALLGCSETPLDTAAFVDTAPSDGPIMEGDKEILDVPPSYRSVGFEYNGPKVSGLSSTTRVWTASRRWYEVGTEAGVAWAANSGLTWDEKYAVWIDSLEATTSEDGHTTVMITTPWGKKLPAPALECAELAMFLRVTFASWYELPFFMSAYSSTNGTIYSGHFGIVNANGAKITGTSSYGASYLDYTPGLAGRSNEYIVANWPDDTGLESKAISSNDDDLNTFLGADAHAGAYFDELFLNKRVGHFLIRLLTWHGSMHLASANNTWNIEPEAIREGDTLLHRWQIQGIGHTMVLKEVDDLPGGNLDVEFVFGSMPRIQPKWYESTIAKGYFTSPYAGSAQTDTNGVAYSHMGGGAKRWRTAITSGDRWVNIVPTVDRDVYIGDTDYPAIEARIVTFQAILGDLTPEEERDALLDRIEMARHALETAPASCTNRQRREQAFDELYALMQSEWGWTSERVDREYRKLEDYVFAELEYTQSKTCCWNSTTAAMATIVMDYNIEQIEAAHDNDQCVEPTVFKARSGGTYAPFAAYATATGRGAQWVAWSADESCPQAGVSEDTEVSAPWSDFCDVAADLMDWHAECVASTEVCNSKDDDCDGTIDEGCGTGGGDTGTDPDPVDPGTGNEPGTGGTGGTDCGEGCDAQRLQGPGSFAWMALGTVGFLARRRRFTL